jgi:hypothetical protein
MAIKALLLINNMQLSDQLAEKAYNYCIKEFSCKTNTERLISAYHNILKSEN